jgi:DNA-directed RNA polymerase subunit E'/Rpb7
VLTEEVDRKYSNRIVMEGGLGICLYDVLRVGDPYIYPSDGASHHRGASTRFIEAGGFKGQKDASR